MKVAPLVVLLSIMLIGVMSQVLVPLVTNNGQTVGSFYPNATLDVGAEASFSVVVPKGAVPKDHAISVYPRYLQGDGIYTTMNIFFGKTLSTSLPYENDYNNFKCETGNCTFSNSTFVDRGEGVGLCDPVEGEKYYIVIENVASWGKQYIELMVIVDEYAGRTQTCNEQAKADLILGMKLGTFILVIVLVVTAVAIMIIVGGVMFAIRYHNRIRNRHQYIPVKP